MSLWIGYMYVYMTDWLSRERKQILPYILIVEDSKKVSSYEIYLKILSEVVDTLEQFDNFVV